MRNFLSFTILLLILCSGCANRKTSDPQIKRALNEYIDSYSHKNIDGRDILQSNYYIYKNPRKEYVDKYIYCYEFNDTAISIMTDRQKPSRIAVNLRDSFYLISFFLDEQLCDGDQFHLEKILELTERAKDWPPPHFEKHIGIVPDDRKSTWRACFVKEVSYKSVTLSTSRNGEFTYIIPYKDLITENQATHYVNSLVERIDWDQLALPPFLIYSFEDYEKYFDISSDLH